MKKELTSKDIILDLINQVDEDEGEAAIKDIQQAINEFYQKKERKTREKAEKLAAAKCKIINGYLAIFNVYADDLSSEELDRLKLKTKESVTKGVAMLIDSIEAYLKPDKDKKTDPLTRYVNSLF